MGQLRLDEILEATGGKVLFGKTEEFSGLSIDSRTIKGGELFVALRGANFDGHNFVAAALEKGAGALVDHPLPGIAADKTFIQTKDTLTALQDIGRYLCRKAAAPVVAVTGTNGKTTTKELIASILGRGLRVLKTTGNLNNHIGVPLCISRMERDSQVMVLEMGSNAAGDIKLLCDIAAPDFAVVTNVGPAHLEGFGSLEAVRQTDLEVLEYARTVCVNADDRFLMEGIKGFSGKIITYGIENRADVTAKDVEHGDRWSSFRICFADGKDVAARLEIPGRFNVLNALAAASIAYEMGFGVEDIRDGLGSFKGVPMRLEIREFEGAVIINDVYNANRASMEEAVRELCRLRRKRTIAVLGDMLELGSYSAAEHELLINKLSEAGVDILIAVGPEMSKASRLFAGSVHTAEDSLQAGDILAGLWKQGDTILVKGSRGMLMERVAADPEKIFLKAAGRAL